MNNQTKCADPIMKDFVSCWTSSAKAFRDRNHERTNKIFSRLKTIDGQLIPILDYLK